jgi:hypothetical protein
MSAEEVSVGQVVRGYVTFLGSEDAWIGARLMSFSYSVNGRRFQKTLGDTVDAWSTATLRKASYGLKVGDPVLVWCSLSDPEVCCIGEKPADKPVMLRLIDAIGAFGYF